MSPLKPWPYNHIREPRPADWGFGMTVCIAAHCGMDRCIVLATDMMVSTVDMSADLVAPKMFPVGRHWVAQFAGDDFSPVTPILDYVTDKLGTEDLADVSQTFSRAYQHRLRQKIETEILRPIGYTQEEFNKFGLKQLGADTFNRVFYDIQQQHLGIEILVSGFDGARPHIFSVQSPGKFTYYSHIGFWAIGSGQTNALGSFFNSRNPVRSLDKSGTLYRVCEAKFNAENAIGVGHTTSVLILHENGSRIAPEHNDIELLRTEWNKTRVLNVPDEAVEIGRKIFLKATPSHPPNVVRFPERPMPRRRRKGTTRAAAKK